MLRTLREIWKDLGRSILVGERYEKNLRGIKLVALLIVAVNIVTGSLNLKNGFYSAAITSPLFILAGLLILYFAQVKRERTKAVITALIAVVIIFTYEAFTVKHGFTIFWTLLLPMAFSYFASVRAGIVLSLYFLLLYCILFFTPLSQIVAPHYSSIIAQRFPILYLADVILTAFIMIQYHRTTLQQMDNAAQLTEAKEAADRANAAKSDFLANMSHEIRTPINAVLGMNEIILRESAHASDQLAAGSKDRARKSLQQISAYAGDVQSAGNNLLAIINNILDFSKIEANRMEIVERPYNFSSVLNDISNLFLFKAKEKDLAFTVDVDSAIPDRLIGDEVRVRQMITNLLTNAVKYTRKGGVTLSVHPASAIDPEPGQTIMLTIVVRDTGIGIREEDLDRVFTKFERVDLKHNSTIEGTGLGLAITQTLVNMMGGDIRVTSEYGKGSAFTLSLPQKIASTEPVGDFRERFARSTQDKKPDEAQFRAPDARILIVDDTRMNLTVASGLLKSSGIGIDTATSGEEAIALAGRNRYDAILMDQRMPEMDGTEAMRRIRAQADGLNRETPVICLTADAVNGARERYLAEGFSDYLTKPIDSRALFRALIRHLPEDLVTAGSPAGDKTDAAAAPCAVDDAFSPLWEVGVDTRMGLGYCQHDENLYRIVLQEFAQGGVSKLPELRRCYENGDWKGYGILAHAIKSTSRMIGAAPLSETAAGLEIAADAGDAASIREEHSGMLADYDSLCEAIRNLVGMNDGEGTVAAPEDDEILEFLPED